jgi:hypothetical protein
MAGFAILMIALGFMVLIFGKRLAILGAGVGALVGVGFLHLLPGVQNNWVWWLIPAGLAILFAFGAGLAKSIVSLFSLALGALAGAAIVMGVLDLFGLDSGLTYWILALVGAMLGAGLMLRFKDWGILILAAVVGALLVVRGFQLLVPSFHGTIASLVGLILAGGALAYHGGLFGKNKSTSK